jgi:hypothetical protein
MGKTHSVAHLIPILGAGAEKGDVGERGDMAEQPRVEQLTLEACGGRSNVGDPDL